MSLISRIGYMLAYIGSLIGIWMLAMTVLDPPYSRADLVLWGISALLLLVGIQLLVADPNFRKLGWAILVKSAPRATPGFSMAAIGVLLPVGIVRSELMRGEPIERYWGWLVFSGGALVIAVILLVRYAPEPPAD